MCKISDPSCSESVEMLVNNQGILDGIHLEILESIYVEESSDASDCNMCSQFVVQHILKMNV